MDGLHGDFDFVEETESFDLISLVNSKQNIINNSISLIATSRHTTILQKTTQQV